MNDNTTPPYRPDFAVQNGQVVPYADATVSIMAPGLTFASTVFEGMRAYWNAEHEQLYILHLHDHLERLQFSMRVIELDNPPTTADFTAQVIACLQANDLREDCYIRVQAYVDDWGEIIATGPVGSSVVCRKRARVEAFTTGKHFAVSSWRRNAEDASPPRIKATANYLNSRLAGLEAKRIGSDGAIILNRDGTVSEGPGGCLFIVREGQLITPPVTAGILESITRRTLLVLAKDMGLDAVERDVGRTELYLAEECLYCGTGQEIVPILSVDGKQIGDGQPAPLTRRLQQSYDDIVRCRNEAYKSWLTPVYAKDGE
ncbi:MAG: branched-chain-amino-acid transaminase [Rhodospirillaceae bacterium]|jgi:branched-chain amino acid aminotransferase|nr:branched-chain-amino-acid transaminase [Rhodospirillaceae bacterium]MBT4045544.1 branched-chain-amino-acid transaminase [Rhodospirillaceae bacterium]MBT4688064.1 branched-chain-amino-acid transaminase [Rhodospirillaceae bacterium]MBT5081728.1 branched-chain-amino-acid transaminase [Rhodospirillaceae bacterium]MBT5527410.1 branched-chain-amino-acid transaminase [Rhodospirillaceae bacterium]